MTNPNQHIDEFLDYYCDLASPQYAVMLKGKWGSGKTHYINEYKKRLDTQEKKYIYVSLYGVTNYDEIETKFLEVLHPRLYNKKTILAGKFAKGLLKATIKVDLDGDDRADGSVSGQIPSLDAGDLLNTKDYILIFDDLERCSIDINDLLGYINYFVEHQDYRVILLANDEKFKSKEEYKDIKEKLIGKEFELVSNVELAYDSFVKELDNQKKIEKKKNIIDILKEKVIKKEENKVEVNPILLDLKEEIIDIYKKSNSNNLRVLRQCIFDFDRFYKTIKLYEYKEELVNDLAYRFFIVYLENLDSSFNILKIEEYFENYIKVINENKEETKYYKLKKKYNIEFFEGLILSIKTWDKIINKSFIDISSVKKELLSSEYYLDENTSNWKKLYYFENLNDESFERVLKDVEKEFIENKNKDIFILKHIYLILIKLNNIGLYSKNIEDINIRLKENIKSLNEENLIKKIDFEIPNSLEHINGYDGVGFVSVDNMYLEVFNNYLNEVLDNYSETKLTEIANEIVLNLDKYELLSNILIYSNTKENDCTNKPVLKYIEIEKFMNEFLKLENKQKEFFGNILVDRYIKNKDSLNILVEELPFLNTLRKKLNSEYEKRKGKVSGYVLNEFIEIYLDGSIKELKKNKDINNEI